MKYFLLLALLITFQAFGDTSLFLFGGGKRPEGALKEFIVHSGGEQSKIVIIPWASEDIEGALNIHRDLSALTSAKIEILSTNIKVIQKQIADATGIFFTGGDQVKLMKQMNELKLRSTLQDKFSKGTAFAGTSAGTAVMSHKMITGEGDFTVINGRAVELAEGLGLLPPSVIVDQHFIIRGRFNRLAGVTLQSQSLGIAVDENNALGIYDNTRARAFGESQALFFVPNGTKKISIDLYEKKDLIDLKRYQAFK